MPDFFKGYEDCFFSSPRTEGYGFLNKLLQVSESLAAASTWPMRHRLFLALLGLLKALFDPCLTLFYAKTRLHSRGSNNHHYPYHHRHISQRPSSIPIILADRS